MLVGGKFPPTPWQYVGSTVRLPHGKVKRGDASLMPAFSCQPGRCKVRRDQAARGSRV